MKYYKKLTFYLQKKKKLSVFSLGGTLQQDSIKRVPETTANWPLPPTAFGYKIGLWS